MPIVTANERFDTTKRQGRIVVCNPTLHTLPTSGANGTSSQFTINPNQPVGNVPTKHGNAYGNNGYRTREALPIPEKHFGQRSNVAIATGGATAPFYTETKGPHPNAHFFDVSRQPKRAPHQPGSSAEDGSAPAGVFKGQSNPATTVMPHQRNGIGANQGKNLSKRATFRASAGGANKSLPSDTPFHKMAVRRKLSVAQTTGVPEPQDTSSHFAGKVSFRSQGNIWYDPNNSYVTGVTSASNNKVGTGRWNIIKRGAAG